MMLDDGPSCDDELIVAARYLFIGMFITWPIVTLILAIVDSSKAIDEEEGSVTIGNGGVGGTEPDESTPLNNTWDV